MSDKSKPESQPIKAQSRPRNLNSGSPRQKDFSLQVGASAARKMKAQQHVSKTIWSGLGMMGLIGWSVAIPTVLGAVLGLWLDEHYPNGRSWTLMMLVLGLCLGCFNAWRWVEKEDRELHQAEDDDDAR